MTKAPDLPSLLNSLTGKLDSVTKSFQDATKTIEGSLMLIAVLLGVLIFVLLMKKNG